MSILTHRNGDTEKVLCIQKEWRIERGAVELVQSILSPSAVRNHRKREQRQDTWPLTDRPMGFRGCTLQGPHGSEGTAGDKKHLRGEEESTAKPKQVGKWWRLPGDVWGNAAVSAQLKWHNPKRTICPGATSQISQLCFCRCQVLNTWTTVSTLVPTIALWGYYSPFTNEDKVTRRHW